jgi:hypothetical protein
MKEELEDKLFEKYPQIFPDGRNVDMKENLMCFGFEHGDGWYNLLDKLFEKITNLLVPPNKIKMIQIKEKFGQLRIYFNQINCTKNIYEKIYKLLDEAEVESGKICEICGNEAKCTIENGWIHTICEKCKRK